MKTKIICALLSVMVLMLLPGCGGDGGSGSGSSSGSGTVSMGITDAKPLIVDEPTELWVTIEEVRVHKSGGGWVSLLLPDTPFGINLLAFYDGNTTELVPPTKLDSGHYTQIRIVISEAHMVVDGNDYPINLEVPSGFLRIDKQFTFEVEDGEAVDITVHFDMSQSISQTGPYEYKMKPVLHITETQRAATICGNIDASSFGDPPEDVVVTVIWNGIEGDETYTEVRVTKEPGNPATDFCIFWLVPLAFSESYTVQITNGFASYVESVAYPELGPGDTFDLNGGANIVIPTS
jgi:hypothetical protein